MCNESFVMLIVFFYLDSSGKTPTTILAKVIIAISNAIKIVSNWNFVFFFLRMLRPPILGIFYLKKIIIAILSNYVI